MIHLARCYLAAALSMLAFLLLPATAHSQAPAAEIGVVLMHGKGGNPGKYVDKLAQQLEQAGFQVANLEMPWSGARQYNVDMTAAENEITSAISALRTKGAKKVFVAGHSQGGLFALHYGALQTVDGLIALAPGGSVDAASFRKALGDPVERARSMVNEGRGNEKAAFADYVVASLPYYIENDVDRVRGKGTFQKSVLALKKLNELGYADGSSGRKLNLDSNPPGAFLAPSQKVLEEDYRRELRARFSISFDNLYTFTNMPIGRFRDYLISSRSLEKYTTRLMNTFNPGTLDALMCRFQISAGWNGMLYGLRF